MLLARPRKILLRLGYLLGRQGMPEPEESGQGQDKREPALWVAVQPFGLRQLVFPKYGSPLGAPALLPVKLLKERICGTCLLASTAADMSDIVTAQVRIDSGGPARSGNSGNG
jgi:hypothetical protein